MVGKTGSNLPPGFRFHPTDEELIVYYLKNQAMSRPCPVPIIPEVDIYKFDPWQLPDKAEYGENEWYFFSPRDRKYPNGARPNRATLSGYWKATGTDKAVRSGAKHVGIKKALVFYQGRPPKGSKTNWVMHEYRLTNSHCQPPVKQQQQQRGSSMRLDDWVLCRIYKKRNIAERTAMDMKAEDQEEDSQVQLPMLTTIGSPVTGTPDPDHHQQKQEPQVPKFPRTVSLTRLLDVDYLGAITHLLNESNPFRSAFESHELGTLDHGGFYPEDCGNGYSQMTEVAYLDYGDPTGTLMNDFVN